MKRHRKNLEAAVPTAVEYEALKSAVYEAEVDLNYTMYYPLAEKYVSLYPRSKDHDSNSIGGNLERKLGGERPVLWFLIERAMKEGTLDELRDGKGKQVTVGRSKDTPAKGVASSKAPNSLVAAPGKNMTGQHNVHAPTNEDEESDGGFFE